MVDLTRVYGSRLEFRALVIPLCCPKSNGSHRLEMVPVVD